MQHEPDLKLKLIKECVCSTLAKLNKNKSPLPFENKKYATPQTNTTMTMKINNVIGLQIRWTRTPAGNSVYVAIAVEVAYRRSVFLRNFVLNGQESASNPLLHINTNR
ncbi:MAG TPA: hypothetical protein DCF44_04210 [Chitinophagaceae bacterium]|nr:hypothetical protein [Chitinophagaceae bacterium]